MALEAVVFRQDQPFGSWNSCGFDFEEEEEEVAACHQETLSQNGGFGFNPNSDSSFCSMIQSMMTNSFSCDGFFAGENPAVKAAPTGNTSCRRKRRRTRSSKNKEEVENQRMTHIAVERNRRKQMNDYLAVLRSLMPPSYVQRGDQASVVGGAINYVKELEQHLQFLESHKRLIFQQQPSVDNSAAAGFSDFFSSPQYSTACSKLHSHQNWKQDSNNYSSAAAEKRSAMGEVEVTMVESHANLKIVSKRHPPKQLLKMVTGLHSLGLNVLHLNVTTLDFTVLYCFSVKVEEECQMVTVNEIAAAVYELVGGIQDDVAL